MDPTSTGRYRALPAPRDEGWLLVDVDDDADDPGAFSPLAVDLADDVVAPGAGNLVRADLRWADDRPTVTDVEVVRADEFVVADDVTDMFEAARETFRAAKATGEGLNSDVLRGTDGDAMGVVYTFAEAGDTLACFRDGRYPLQPLVARVDADRDGDAPLGIYLLRPTGGAFVAVVIAFDRAGLLAETLRDTYDL